MLYRKLPKGEEEISILGIGTSSIQVSSEKEIEEIVAAAIENGINFFDMASSEAKSHYENLEVKADACIQCGHCNKRCPFHVNQMARMGEIDSWFCG